MRFNAAGLPILDLDDTVEHADWIRTIEEFDLGVPEGMTREEYAKQQGIDLSSLRASRQHATPASEDEDDSSRE